MPPGQGSEGEAKLPSSQSISRNFTYCPVKYFFVLFWMTIHIPSDKQTTKTQDPEISQNSTTALQSTALDPKTWETTHPPWMEGEMVTLPLSLFTGILDAVCSSSSRQVLFGHFSVGATRVQLWFLNRPDWYCFLHHHIWWWGWGGFGHKNLGVNLDSFFLCKQSIKVILSCTNMSSGRTEKGEPMKMSWITTCRESWDKRLLRSITLGLKSLLVCSMSDRRWKAPQLIRHHSSFRWGMLDSQLLSNTRDCA